MPGIWEGTLERQMIVLCVERDGRRAYYRAADAVEHVMVAEGGDWVERVDGRPTHRWIGDAQPLGSRGRRIDLAVGTAVDFALERRVRADRIPAPCASQAYAPRVDELADARMGARGRGAAGTPLPIVRRALATTRDGSFVITANGDLWAWGQNDWGKLGDGAYEPQATPVRVGGDFASVFAGPDSVVAIKRDGSLWSWRQTRSMQGERRGNSLSGSGFVTHMVRRIGEGFVHASAAGYGSGVVAVGEDGSLWAEYTPAVRPIPPATGDQGEQILDAFRPARVGEGFVDLLEGNIARKADGSHWRLIVRPSHASPRTPQTRECYAEARRIENLPEGLGVKVLRHAGDTQFVAIDRAGGLWTWGEGYPRSAPLGDGAAVSRSTPVRIGTGFVDVSAQGTHHRVALRKDGSVWSWGAPFESWTSPPPGTFAPPTVVGKGYRQVAAGPQHTLALGLDGRVRAWGYNSAGQVGIDAQTAVIDRPVRLQAGVASVAAGRAHSLALRRDGTLLGWGANVCGQLGRSDPAPSYHPVTLAKRIRHIAAGEHASYAIATDGTLWRWGTESNLCRPDRQVGTPVPPGFGNPERLGAGFATMTANGRAVLFLDRDGRWWEPDDRAGSPLRELAARDHAQIVRSSSTYFGLGRDGTLQAWGGETSYDHPAFSRTLDQRAQPGVPVPIGSGYSAIAVSDLQSFTIRADGTLIAWGDTTLGQLGIRRSMPFRPVRVVFPDAREAQESSSPVITGAVR